VSLHPFGEVLSRPENRVTVDPSRTDRYGVPLMRIDVRFGGNEAKMRRHMYDTCEEILHTLGASFNQMHEVENVFVVDGSAFTSASEKNPTLTIVALAWRATDYLAEELRTGRL